MEIGNRDENENREGEGFESDFLVVKNERRCSLSDLRLAGGSVHMK